MQPTSSKQKPRLLGLLRKVAKKKAVASPASRTQDVWDGFYEKFRRAETGTVPRHMLDNDNEYWRRTFVRNAPGGSSAYGPVQMTGTLFRDMKENPKKYGLNSQEVIDSIEFMLQGERFLKHGNTMNAPQHYDYSGRGDLEVMDSKESVRKKAAYKALAKKVMREHFIRGGGSEEAMVELWRGKSRKEDPDYYRRYFGK